MHVSKIANVKKIKKKVSEDGFSIVFEECLGKKRWTNFILENKK